MTARKKREVFVVEGPDGQPRNIDYERSLYGLSCVFATEDMASDNARQIDRVVRYIPAPAPTKKKPKRKKR